MLLVRGLGCTKLLAALWNNQKETRAAKKLARKWRLDKAYGVTQEQIEDAMMRSGRGINLGCEFALEICAQLGIEPAEVDPMRTKGELNGRMYDAKNGAGCAEQVIDHLRQSGSVERIFV